MNIQFNGLLVRPFCSVYYSYCIYNYIYNRAVIMISLNILLKELRILEVTSLTNIWSWRNGTKKKCIGSFFSPMPSCLILCIKHELINSKSISKKYIFWGSHTSSGDNCRLFREKNHLTQNRKYTKGKRVSHSFCTAVMAGVGFGSLAHKYVSFWEEKDQLPVNIQIWSKVKDASWCTM